MLAGSSDLCAATIKCTDSGHNRTAVSYTHLPGGYNIYNAAAEAAVAHVVGIDEQTAVSALSQFECGFGRAEQFKLCLLYTSRCV